MSDFLLEIRCEEIPARMQKAARAELDKLFQREMTAAGVEAGELTVWSTPRRLALILRDLPAATEAVSEEAKGPPEGAPDQAIDGFCRKNGVTRDQLEVRDVKGRNTYFAVKDIPGRAVADVLAEAIPTIIRDFSWPKSMRWGDASISTESPRWVRPLSGIVALFGGEVVECEAGGISSGNTTIGHRFHSSGEVTIASADSYAETLRAAHVIVDHVERESIVRDGAKAAAEAAGLKLVEDEGLVVENAGLTEWPVPLLGRFEDDFLDVPPETIQLTARVNQKYFVCEDSTGKLANAFICTANMDAADPAVVVDGNRKVLAARLADARFFWELDQKKTLAQHAKGLERITFHEKLGTVAERCDRIGQLLGKLLAKPDNQNQLMEKGIQLAHAAKADLVTEMVGEFPDLQGLMGYYYMRAEGGPESLAEAVRDQYLPRGPSDPIPTEPMSYALAIADKLEQICSFFVINEKPTGSKDPYALRRAALGLIRLIIANNVRGSLRNLAFISSNILAKQSVEKIISFYENELSEVEDAESELTFEPNEGQISFKGLSLPIPPRLAASVNVAASLKEDGALDKVSDEVFAFIIDRLKVQQKEAGVRHDIIDAVFALGGEDDLVRLLARVKALQAFVETEDGTNLLAGYKRAANILKKEKHETVRAEPVEARLDDSASPALRQAQDERNFGLSYTPEPSEKTLIDALDAAEPLAASALAKEDFASAMSALATLRAPIDRFFEDVIVNAEEKAVRSARLDLLARFRGAVHQVADFSRIEG